MWNVRFVFHSDTGTKASLVSVAKAKVVKCTLLYPLPGFVPTVQAENNLRHGVKARAGELI